MQLVKANSNMQRVARVVIVILLAAIAAVAAVPNYFHGQWPWTTPLQVSVLNQMSAIKESGLELEGWSVLVHDVVSVGGQDWTLTEFQPEQSFDTPTSIDRVTVLTHAQTWYKDQPEVEWIDLAGTQGWTTDSQKMMSFQVSHADSRVSEITARFLRGWNERQTFALVQWYAWVGGGHPSPGRWFFADQQMQWRDRTRMPWIAVSILIPIEPLGQIQPYETLALAISQAVQTAINQGPFAPLSS